jgi:predicted metal-binding protein
VTRVIDLDGRDRLVRIERILRSAQGRRELLIRTVECLYCSRGLANLPSSLPRHMRQRCVEWRPPVNS